MTSSIEQISAMVNNRSTSQRTWSQKSKQRLDIGKPTPSMKRRTDSQHLRPKWHRSSSTCQYTSMDQMDEARRFVRRRSLTRNYPVQIHLGASTTASTLDLFLQADVCVTAPEPLAIETTYRFCRALYLRVLRRTLTEERFRLRLVELDVRPSMSIIAERFLGIALDYLGHIEHDETVWRRQE